MYLYAFIAAAAIFGVGIWVGLRIEQDVAQGLSDSMEKTRQQITTIETMLLLEEGSALCDFFGESIDRFDKETYELGTKIGYMEEKRGAPAELKADYMFLELRDYLLIKHFDNKCNRNSKAVLYFLSSSNCSHCLAQGGELTKAKSATGVRVYSFDVDVNSTLVRALINKYNATQYPALVIDEKMYPGLMEVDKIVAAVG
jgi:thiol-disulfide isomerase/thioredoxin